MTSDSVRWARSDPAALWAARQIGIKDLDSASDVRQIQQYLEQNETPWDRQVRLANERTDQILNDMKTQDAAHALAIQNLTDQFSGSITQIGADNQTTIDTLTKGFETREATLNQFIVNQRADFDARYGKLNDSFNLLSDSFDALNLQYDELNAANAEQQRLAGNAARASVPAPVSSAELPQTGDSRDQQERLGKNNNLSQLTVLSGLGNQGNATSGLQLA
jgi:hypothetical protein